MFVYGRNACLFMNSFKVSICFLIRMHSVDILIKGTKDRNSKIRDDM